MSRGVRMEIWRRLASRVVFSLAVTCFFLPFATVYSMVDRVASYTGIQLVRSMIVTSSSELGVKRTGLTGGGGVAYEPLAIAAFLCGVLGFCLSLIRDRRGITASSAAAFLGLILLLWLQSKLKHEIVAEFRGLLHLDFGLGYFLVLKLFLIGAVLNVYFAMGECSLLPRSPIHEEKSA